MCVWVQRRVGGVEEKCEEIGGVGDEREGKEGAV